MNFASIAKLAGVAIAIAGAGVWAYLSRQEIKELRAELATQKAIHEARLAKNKV